MKRGKDGKDTIEGGENKRRKIQEELSEEDMLSLLYTDDTTELKAILSEEDAREFLSAASSFPYLTRNTVKVLLDAGIDENDKNVMFHIAAQEGHVDILEILLKRGGCDVDRPDSEGATAMHCVFYEPDDYMSVDRNDRIEVVKFLIDMGAKSNCKDKPDEWTPLHYAARGGFADVATVLIKNAGADVKAVSTYNRTPLHIAAEEGNIEVARVLLENRADVNAEGMGKLTAFHLACIQGNCDLAMLLVNHGADVNAANLEKSTGLHMACRTESIELVRYLLEQNDLDVTSKRSALSEAQECGNLDIAQLLIDNGAQTELGKQNEIQ